MRRNLGLGLLYLVPTLVLLGGLGDLAIQEPLEVQQAFLTDDGAYPLSPPAERAFLVVLHVMAGGLVGIGASGLLLVHYGVRAGQCWAVVALAVAILAAEGANTLGMWMVGSPFWVVTASYLGLLTVGLALRPWSIDR